MGILLSMETTATLTQPKKKRGPAPKLGRMVDTHIHVEPHLLEWAKQKPEGFAGLVRRLLKQEHARDAATV
jgi:hypothetical protein